MTPTWSVLHLPERKSINQKNFAVLELHAIIWQLEKKMRIFIMIVNILNNSNDNNNFLWAVRRKLPVR